ncbi:SAP30-binding protein-like [Telopea speciosissima]|uniref:SAP30-binding protein-like n=1 Tax=Telopea speciosissima TaxID=54955 RepID=UPI001CC43B42|nr:SAP30-binding protein-like [Telopea speciosissima]
MASKRKESEGIALLSMYNDEDEDMDDVDEEEDNREDAINNDAVSPDSTPEATPHRVQSQASIPTEDSTPKSDRFASLTPQQPQILLNSPLLPSQTPPSSAPFSDAQRTRKGTLAIVDYAHDETAMSPEAEEGEIVSAGRVMFGEELETANGDFQEKTPQGMVQILTDTQATPQPSEQPPTVESDNTISINGSRIDPEDVGVEEAIMVSTDVPRDADPLDKFLPPPPKAKCSEQLQEKINKFLAYKRAGKSFNAEVRNRKDYRNPDFLRHAVRYQDIVEMGSCFSKEVFDPHGYDKSDYYEELAEADMRCELERKDQGAKKNQRIEFASGGTQPGTVPAGPKINVPIPGTASDALARDGRQNKKSKWDKVDGDQRNPLLPGGQDTVSKVGAHATLLSAANLGAGYTAFAQQRRKEAEEKKSSERKLERRS